jgi:DNA-binding response OmpR family regulator
MKRTILLMDNVPAFLDSQARLLERAGYRVLRAATIAEAECILRDDWVHLAILDIRMEQEDNEYDISGLLLAQNAQFRHVPKIMLTQYPSWESTREALNSVHGAAPAADYLAKGKGFRDLLDGLESTFAEYVKLNWDLNIAWKSSDSFSLVRWIHPNAEGDLLLSRAGEFDDLLRFLFRTKEQITIGQRIWHHEERVALVVFAFTAGRAPESFIVVCGSPDRIADEADRYQTFAPKAPGDARTVLVSTAQTTHFAANAYSLAEIQDLTGVRPLVQLYQTTQERIFQGALDQLFDSTLVGWRRGTGVVTETPSPGEWYHRRLIARVRSHSEFEQRVQALINQGPVIDVRVERADGLLHVRFDTRTFTYPDPLQAFESHGFKTPAAAMLTTPGMLRADTILADNTGHTWLTDFGAAGPAPESWNFVAIEALIRFDWVETSSLLRLHEMEQSLTGPDFPRIDMRDLEPVVRKGVRAIQTIRSHASLELKRDPGSYQLGLLYEALQRLGSFDPKERLMPAQLIGPTHVLIAAAMIWEWILRAGQPIAGHRTRDIAAIRVDRAEHAVWIDSRRVPLRGQSYEFLVYLYEHANRLCVRRELVERVLREVYDEKDDSQINRLNMAIHRLREKIEDNPDEPKLLMTEPGGGYRLVVPDL